MRLFLGGAEVPGHRNMLAEAGVNHVSLSYMGLRRRTKFTRPWTLQDKFLDGQEIFLDSGAYTVNKDGEEDKYTQSELKDIAAHYMSFVTENIDRLTLVTEFDALPLGREWIDGVREDFYDDLPDGKFLPVWHDASGLDELDRLAQKYQRVAVFSTESGGRNITPYLNGLVNKYGTLLHGVNMSKVDDMHEVQWDTISTISWLSPSQYGDTIVWTGKELKRYPKKYKDQARRRHRTYFTDKGFDADLIEADDKNEVLRLSIWSWQQVEAHVNREDTGNVVSIFDYTGDGQFAQEGVLGVDTSGVETDKPGTTLLPIRERERINLPIMSLTTQKETYTEDGERKEREIPLLRTRSQSMRVCTSCHLSKKCPAYDPGANCAYDIPVEVQSKDQVLALQNSMIEMQTQRIYFMRMAEDLEGGYADPNLSSEMDRLQKMLQRKHDMEQESFSLNVTAKGPAQAGMISRLFGRDAGDTAKALPAAMTVEQVNMEILDIDFDEDPKGS